MSPELLNRAAYKLDKKGHTDRADKMRSVAAEREYEAALNRASVVATINGQPMPVIVSLEADADNYDEYDGDGVGFLVMGYSKEEAGHMPLFFVRLDKDKIISDTNFELFDDMTKNTKLQNRKDAVALMKAIKDQFNKLPKSEYKTALGQHLSKLSANDLYQ